METTTHPATVLIVDDRPENLLTLEGVLQPLGHELVRAGSGEEALRVLLQTDVAVIILDVLMPDMDGFETARRIKERRKTRTIPIIFLTAATLGDTQRLRGYESGAVDYIAKPYEPEVLRAKVAVFLELHMKTRMLRDQASELERRNADLRAAQRSLAAQAAELARSNAALERFVHVVSHDLREPLRTMSGFLELIDERTATDDPTTRSFIARARAGAARMDRLIEELLRSSLAEERRLEMLDVDLGQILGTVLEDLTAEIIATGAHVVYEPLPVVRADAARIAQVFQNLVSNALKYRSDDPPEVTIWADPGDEGWTLHVRDNGIGVDPQDVPHIFTMFGRGADHHRDGSGIGLGVCRKIIEAHGGRIWVESAAQGGSTFSFTLPARIDAVR